VSNSITYSLNGSKTTRPINTAPYSIQLAWRYANKIGAAIIRVRSNQERYEYTEGDAFSGTHNGLVSVYIPLKNPRRFFFFRKDANQVSFLTFILRKLGFKKNTMQIFEVPKKQFDLDEVCSVIKRADVYNNIPSPVPHTYSVSKN